MILVSLEEDRSRGVPSRAEAHADEKGQAKEGENMGMKSNGVLARDSTQGQDSGGGWLTQDVAAAPRGISVLPHRLQPDGLHISSTSGLALVGTINPSLNEPMQLQNGPEKGM